jgi:hypothetical protein
MTKVTITPQNIGSPNATFRAAARGRDSEGRTPGAALDALTQQLDEAETNTLVIVQNMRPDEFFTASQQQRLAELLSQRRIALDAGRETDSGDNSELETLIDAELDGAARRSAAMLKELRP